MRVLALDLGSKRIGVALSDSEGAIASPLTTLERRSDLRDIATVGELVREHAVGEIVVGLPLHLSGRRGPEAEHARRFAGALAEATGLPVITLDERLTTVEAEHALRESGRKGAKRRAVIDAVAAAILLRAHLERRRARRPEVTG
jgi:putative Holliday junction resolvase